jgi:Lrp/AsnC family transcriptional regulator, leucine-responsive regulatory protein
MNATSTHLPRSLDRFDRAILRILQKNNRTPHRAIAEKINLSAAAVQRRIAALEARGVISANVAIISPNALRSQVTVVVEVHLDNDRSTVVDPMKSLFRETAEVQQCYYVAGNGGFILIVLVPDMASYEAFSRRMFAENDKVATFRTLVVLDSVKVGLEIDIPTDS